MGQVIPFRKEPSQALEDAYKAVENMPQYDIKVVFLSNNDDEGGDDDAA